MRFWGNCRVMILSFTACKRGTATLSIVALILAWTGSVLIDFSQSLGNSPSFPSNFRWCWSSVCDNSASCFVDIKLHITFLPPHNNTDNIDLISWNNCNACPYSPILEDPSFRSGSNSCNDTPWYRRPLLLSTLSNHHSSNPSNNIPSSNITLRHTQSLDFQLSHDIALPRCSHVLWNILNPTINTIYNTMEQTTLSSSPKENPT